MFTGIIESLGTLKSVTKEGTNKRLKFESAISSELKVDQSISHNGVCLTVEKQYDNIHEVVAIQETLDKSNLGKMSTGHRVNLERCMQFNGRLDGHLVQGHVDGIGSITDIEPKDGSWKVTIQHDSKNAALVVPKGSITIDGVSLTVVDCDDNSFSVAIIPYTWEHTVFHTYSKGDTVNLEYDIIGKYVLRAGVVGR